MTTKTNLIPDRSGPGSTTAALPSDPSRGGSGKFATGEENLDRQNVAKVEMVIATWNVRTLRESGKVDVLVQEMNQLEWNILGISEMRWKGIGEGTTEDGHKIWFSGGERNHERGVGFLVNKNSKNSVLEYTPVSDRIAAIRVAGKPLNITIVQVYAPTSDCCDETIDEFYDDLEKLLKTIPRKDVLVVQGDWNAKIGEDAFKDWKGTVGRFGLGETNCRGLKLLEFAKRHQLTATTTLFNHKVSRKSTWHSPDGKTHNQIDWIFISRRFVTGVNRAKTRTFNKPDIGSDHDLVMMTLKIKLKTTKKNETNRTRFDLEKLKDTVIAEQYQEELASRFAPLLLLNHDPQTLCDEFTNTLESVAEVKLGKARKIKKPWITTEVLEACDDRREKKRRRKLGPHELTEYRTANRKTRNALNEAKNKWIMRQSNEIEENLSRNNTKKAYEVVKKLCGAQKDEIKKKQTGIIEDKDGNLLTKSDDILKRWKDYCEELFNYDIQKNNQVLEEEKVEEQQEEEEILLSEVQCAIKELKKNKTPGADNISAELIQNGGEATEHIIHKLCNKILRTKQWPSQWTESMLITIAKKTNSRKCSDYRTISLISHASKVLLKIIQKRITPRIEEVLSDSQAGFRRGRSTVEQITTLRLLNEKARDTGKMIFHNFIDFRKAFDRVWHAALWHTMRKYNIGEGITSLVQKLYESSRSKVLVGDQYSEWFKTNIGVRQGCLLSPTLFNLFLERIMTDALEDYEGGVRCAGRRIVDLRFADDIDLMEESENGIQEVTKRLEDASKKFGMEISTEKSKLMVVGKEENIDGQVVDVLVDGIKLEQVKNFTYLGSTLVANGKSEKEIRIRIGRATSALANLDNIWRAKNITLKNKLLLMRSIVMANLLYACESWTVSKKDEQRLRAFEMKTYRRMLGISWKEKKTNEWVNNKIFEICRYEPEGVVEIVKKRKFKYFGHLVRGGGTARAVMEGSMQGRRGKGRPQGNWMGNLREWSGKGCFNLTRMAEDRERWRQAVHSWVHPRPPRLRS